MKKIYLLQQLLLLFLTVFCYASVEVNREFYNELSPKPLGVISARETIDQEIILTFNGELNTLNHFLISSFSASVNGRLVTVLSVVLSEEDSSSLLVRLDENIYSDDFITISYDGSIEISSDEYVDSLAPFTNLSIDMFDGEILPEEVSNASLFKPYWRNSDHVELSDEQVFIGANSLKMGIRPGELTSEASADVSFNMQEGFSYEISFKAFIDPNSTTLPSSIQLFMIPDWGFNIAMVINSSTPRGEWIQITGFYHRVPRDVMRLWIRMVETQRRGDATVFLDDFHVTQIDERPGEVEIKPTEHNVTFKVDMKNYTGYYTVPEVNGSFNAWCGSCNKMTNVSGNIWEVSVPMIDGDYEYKYTHDNWMVAERLTSDMECTNQNNDLTNRIFTVDGSDIELDLVDWSSCMNETLSINSKTLSSNESMVYPNPVADFLNIRTGIKKIKKATLYDSLGEVVIHKEKVSKLNVNGLSSGVYILKIIFENEVTSIQKVIKL